MFKTFLRDESGASAAEYALILAVVGAAIAAAAFFLGDAVRESIDTATTEVDACANAQDDLGAACTEGAIDPRDTAPAD